MTLVEQFQEPADFWNGMVLPDYHDHQADIGDLRKALHSAISLFHMSDWVFVTHEQSIRQLFTFVDRNSETHHVRDEKTFANSLEAICPDFALIRGIAHAAKHLKLNNFRPHPDAPSHSANTQSLGCGMGAFGVGPYGGGPQVMLEGTNGHLHFSQIAGNVLSMWTNLNSTRQWW